MLFILKTDTKALKLKPNKMTRTRKKPKTNCSQRTIEFSYPDGAMIMDERLVKVLRVQVGE